LLLLLVARGFACTKKDILYIYMYIYLKRMIHFESDFPFVFWNKKEVFFSPKKKRFGDERSFYRR
tara:strand:+ start:2813 stop:3007 length:195 start_codon:yes stop_codon:yes gene_type:complete